jgi:hypothetical protein
MKIKNWIGCIQDRGKWKEEGGEEKEGKEGEEGEGGEEEELHTSGACSSVFKLVRVKKPSSQMQN